MHKGKVREVSLFSTKRYYCCSLTPPSIPKIVVNQASESAGTKSFVILRNKSCGADEREIDRIVQVDRGTIRSEKHLQKITRDFLGLLG